MEKTKISRYILFISIFSLVTLFTFLVQQSYSRLIAPTTDLSTSPLQKPINPVLDMEIFDLIESKKYYPPIETQIFSP